MASSRLPYMDVAKGLGIVLVLYYHVPLYVRMSGATTAESLAGFIESAHVFLPFFMPVFFVISGFFMHSSKSFGRALWSDVRHLLLFGLLLQFINTLIQIVVYGSGVITWWLSTLFSLNGCCRIIFAQWFVSAIFWARLVDRCCDCLTRGNFLTKGLLLLMVSCLGVVTEPYLQGIKDMYLSQGLVMALYLYAGQLLARLNPKRQWLLLMGVGYVLLLLMCYFSGVSTLEYGMVNASYTISHHPRAILLALTGSALLIALADYIGTCRWLEFVGRNSLVFYIPQGGCLVASCALLQRFFQPDTTPKLVFFMLLVVAGSAAVLSVLSWLLAQKDWVKTQASKLISLCRRG